jgi:hypothetical protein
MIAVPAPQRRTSVAQRIRVEHGADELRIDIEGPRGIGAVVFAGFFTVWAVGMGLGFEIVIGRELARESTSLGTAILGSFLLVFPVCAALGHRRGRLAHVRS